MIGCLDARRTLKGLVADLSVNMNADEYHGRTTILLNK